MEQVRTKRGVYLLPEYSPHRISRYGLTFIFPSESRMNVFEKRYQEEFNRLLSHIYAIRTITGLDFRMKEIYALEKSTMIKVYNSRESWEILEDGKI